MYGTGRSSSRRSSPRATPRLAGRCRRARIGHIRSRPETVAATWAITVAIPVPNSWVAVCMMAVPSEYTRARARCGVHDERDRKSGCGHPGAISQFPSWSKHGCGIATAARHDLCWAAQPGIRLVAGRELADSAPGWPSAGFPVRSSAHARARARCTPTAPPSCRPATQEFGTGMATGWPVAADGLGLDLHNVRFELGDTDLQPRRRPWARAAR